MADNDSARPDVVPASAKSGRLAVLYDGGCAMCRVSAEAVRMFDNSGTIDLLDLHDEDVRRQFPDLDMDRLMEELHVVDDRGRVWRGARAINQVLRHQRGMRGIVAWLWYVPGFALLADWQYKRIARSRYGRDGRGRVAKASPASES